MPFQSEHSARIIEPDKFQDDSFRRIEITTGIEAIIGKLEGEDQTTTQAYRFDAQKFTVQQAKDWLKENNVEYILFEEALNNKSMYIIPINGVIGEDFTFTDALMHLNAAKEEQVIKLLINSPGGYVDEGIKIRDAINNSGKTIHTCNSGDVMSIAVSLFLTGTERQFNPNKGQFLIHNPWGTIEGESKDFEQAAKELKSIETDLLNEYSSITGADKAVLKGFMDENKPLTSDQVKELGFANVIESEPIKAVAYFKRKNNDMSTEVKLNEEQSKQLAGLETQMSGFGKLLKNIMNFVKPKALVKQDVNGTELDFGDEVETEDQIAIGSMATVEGQAAEGEYVMEDGRTLVFEAGVIVEIKPSSESEMAALKEELETLKAENESLKAEKETLNQNVEAVTEEKESAVTALAKLKEESEKVSEEFTKFKAQFSEFTPKAGAPEPDPDKKQERKGFKYNGIRNKN